MCSDKLTKFRCNWFAKYGNCDTVWEEYDIIECSAYKADGMKGCNKRLKLKPWAPMSKEFDGYSTECREKEHVVPKKHEGSGGGGGGNQSWPAYF